MNCGRVSNQLSAYLDRELTGLEMLQIRSHLRDCVRCRAEGEALGRMKMLLGRLRSMEPPRECVMESVWRCELSGAGPSTSAARREPLPWLSAALRRLRQALAANGVPCPVIGASVLDAPGAARHVLGLIPWQPLTVGLTTAVLAAALVFTNVVLHRHSDTLVASTPSLVLEGRQDQAETPQFFDRAPGDLALRRLFRDRLPDGQTALPWVNVSLQGETSWTFR